MMGAFMEEKLRFLANNEDAEFPAGPIVIEITEEKSFNKCLKCQFLSNGCSGPNMTAMTAERACEFLQLRRLLLGYTYKKTATLSKLSEVTVKRYLTNKVKDPSFLIIQALSYALICDPQGKQPCPIHLFPDEVEQATVACKAAKDALAQKEKEFEQALDHEYKKTDHLKDQVKFQEEQLRVKDKQLDERASYLRIKDRYIAVLASLLGVAIISIIVLLI
jgi:transcriptional regulator with XRE-family HTH domain